MRSLSRPKNGCRTALTGEVADLVYHLLVLLAWHGITPSMSWLNWLPAERKAPAIYA